MCNVVIYSIGNVFGMKIFEIFYEIGFEFVCWCFFGYFLIVFFFKILFRKFLCFNLFMNWYVCVNEIFKCSKGWKVFLFYYSMFLVISGIIEIENYYYWILK